jgi:hypothetical protein
LSISFLVYEKPNVYRAARPEGGRTRAKGSLAVGLHWQVVFGCQMGWNKSTRRAGERGGVRVGRPGWLRILTITGGSSIPVLRLEGAAMIFKVAAVVRAVFDVDVDLSGANAVLESLSDWHRKLIEIGRGR